MGMDISAHLTYGIKIPEDLENEDAEGLGWGEMLENLIDPWEDDAVKKYEGLEIVYVGFCDDPTYVIATVSHCADWCAEPVEIEKLVGKPSKDLERFCKDLNIKYAPQWYLSPYYSH